MTCTDPTILFNSLVKNYNQSDTLNIFGQNFGVSTNNNLQPNSTVNPSAPCNQIPEIVNVLPNCACNGNGSGSDGDAEVDFHRCDNVKLYNTTDLSLVGYDFVYQLSLYFGTGN